MILPSEFGGEKEGIVIRLKDTFPFDKYIESTAKYVRENHVQTDVHWSKNWNPANIRTM